MQTWLDAIHGLVRPCVMLALTGTAIWMALTGQPRAAEALLAQFIAVTAFYFGERSALKIPPSPGQDRG